MIVDYLGNDQLYRSFDQRFEMAFEFLSNTKLRDMSDGRYPLDEDAVYAIVQSYSTELEQKRQFEAHRHYADIQYIVEGREIIYWLPMQRAPEGLEYSKQLDAVSFESHDGSSIPLSKNFFAVFFPQDAHKPGCVWTESTSVKKVVMKIRLTE